MLALALCACGTDTSTGSVEETASPQPEATAEATPEVDDTIIYYGLDIDASQDVSDLVLKEVDTYYGANYTASFGLEEGTPAVTYFRYSTDNDGTEYETKLYNLDNDLYTIYNSYFNDDDQVLCGIYATGGNPIENTYYYGDVNYVVTSSDNSAYVYEFTEDEPAQAEYDENGLLIHSWESDVDYSYEYYASGDLYRMIGMVGDDMYTCEVYIYGTKDEANEFFDANTTAEQQAAAKVESMPENTYTAVKVLEDGTAVKTEASGDAEDYFTCDGGAVFIVYDTVEADGSTWYAISAGDSECWIEATDAVQLLTFENNKVS